MCAIPDCLLQLSALNPFPEQLARSSLIDPKVSTRSCRNRGSPRSRIARAAFSTSRSSSPIVVLSQLGYCSAPLHHWRSGIQKGRKRNNDARLVTPVWRSSLALRSFRSILTFDLTQWFFATHMKHRGKGMNSGLQEARTKNPLAACG